MRKYAANISLIFILALTGTGCLSDSDILSSFKDGTVTRKEVRDYYKAFRVKEEPRTTSAEFQENLVRRLTFEKIVFNNFNTMPPEDIDGIMGIIEKQIRMSIYKNNFSENAEKNGKVKLFTTQILLLRKNSNPDANAHLAKLNSMGSDSDIAKYITENTGDNGRKAVGGHMEPMCYNCGMDPLVGMFQEGYNSDTDKFFLAEDENNYYIYRIADRITEGVNFLDKLYASRFNKLKKMAVKYAGKDNIRLQEANYFLKQDINQLAKRNADHVKMRFLSGNWKTDYDTILKNSGYTINYDYNNSKNYPALNTALISGKDYEYKYSDLKNDFAKFLKIAPPNMKTNDPAQELRFFYDFILPVTVISTVSGFDELKNNPAYAPTVQFIRQNIVFKNYEKGLTSGISNVSEKEMMDTYEAGKLYAYSKPDPRNRTRKIPIPYAEVRERIKNDILNNKRKQVFDENMKKLTTDFNIKIHSESLKNGKL